MRIISVGLATTLSCVLSTLSAGASPYVPLTEEHLNPEPIVIEVPREDLEMCIATLQSVFSAPVSVDIVQSASVTEFPGPQVTCKVK